MKRLFRNWPILLLLLAMLGPLGYAVANDYYTHGSFPSPSSPATSASMRAELDSITAGFDKLVSLTGNANKAVVVNGAANALTTTTGTLSLAGNFAISGAYATTLTVTADTALTLPATGTLATLAGAETLTNKTLTNPSVIGTVTGTITYSGLSTFAGGLNVSGGTQADALSFQAPYGLTLAAQTGSSYDFALINAAGTAFVFNVDTGTNNARFNGTVDLTAHAPKFSSISNTGTLTLPTSTDTLVGRATTDTLTNKTLSGATLSGTTTNSGTISGGTISSPTISNGVINTSTVGADPVTALGIASKQYVDNSQVGNNAIKANLLVNSRFSVWSTYGPVELGSAISCSAYTTASNTVVCTTANTQGILVNDQLIVDPVADASLTSTVHTVTAVSTNASITFTLPGSTVAGGAGGAITMHQATVGDLTGGSSGDACDWWSKTTTAKVWRESHVVQNGSLYALGYTKGSASAETLSYNFRPAETVKASDLQTFSNRTTVFGLWVYPTAANQIRIFVSDNVGTTYSGYAQNLNAWNWLEISRTISASPSSIGIGVSFEGASSTTGYVAQAIAGFGSTIGSGNYFPPDNDVVDLKVHITPATYNGAAVTASQPFKIVDETNGGIPLGVRAIYFALEGQNGTSVGSGATLTLQSQQNPPVNYSFILYSQVGGIVISGGGHIQIVNDQAWIAKGANGNWGTVSMDISRVYL